MNGSGEKITKYILFVYGFHYRILIFTCAMRVWKDVINGVCLLLFSSTPVSIAQFRVFQSMDCLNVIIYCGILNDGICIRNSLYNWMRSSLFHPCNIIQLRVY